DSLLSLVQSGDLFVTLDGTLRYGEKDFAIEGKAKLVDKTVVMDLTVAGKRINLVYDDRISLVVPAWGLGVECTAEEFEEIFSSVSKTSEGEESDSLAVSVDLAKILRSIEAFADESALLGLKIDLSSVMEGLILTASVHEDSLALKSTDITAEGFTVKSLSLLVSDGKDRTVEIVPASVSLHKAELDSLLQMAKAERFHVMLYSDGISAEATIGTDGKISGSFAQKYVRGTFSMEGNTVYLKVGTLAVRCGLDSVQDALSTLFGVNGLTDQDALQTSELILDLLNWDLGGVRWQTYDGKLGATIDTPALLKQFGVQYDLPELRMDYSYTTHTLWAGMDGVSVTVAPTERKYNAPSGSYASLDALLSGLKNAIGFQANTSVDVNGTAVTLELRGELVWDGKVSDGAFVLRGVIEAQIDSVTMDGSFETDGKRIRLSIGSFGVELGFDEIESLMAKLPEVADQISENITNVPQGSIDTVDRLNVLFAALGLFDAAPDLSGLESLFGEAANEEEMLKALVDSLTGGYVREWNGKLQATIPCVSIGDFSTGAISMALYLSSGEEMLADPTYLNGLDAEHWTKEDFDWLLDAVVGTSSLVCNESFTLDYQFDILSDDEAYRAYDGVRFRANGTLRYYTGEEANLRVYLYVDLTLQATNLTKDSDL
ncbi:MAG: hypothetical protein ACI4U2_04600, partial [Christensenellaceae bacterium]